MPSTVSVIIPAWGRTPQLERARESILAQTLPGVEVLVSAPPASAPQTAIAARWAALEKANGEWIAFCDADDWMERDALAEMMRTAERESADCVCCGFVRDGADGRSVRRPFDHEGPSDTYNALVAKLFRRDLLEGLLVDTSLTLGEDLMVTAQALRKARRTAVMDKIFYHYCENDASVTHVQDGRKRVEDLARVGEILREAMPEAAYGDFHDRVTRDALLLWIRYRLFDRKLWRTLRARMKGGLLADPRHGIIKKGALACAACLFD